MANWQRTLDVKDVWDSGDNRLIVRTAASRLKNLVPFPESLWPTIEARRLELVEELEDLSDDPETTTRDFDYVWSDLYDWADTSLDDKWNGMKVCWVKTF